MVEDKISIYEALDSIWAQINEQYPDNNDKSQYFKIFNILNIKVDIAKFQFYSYNTIVHSNWL